MGCRMLRQGSVFAQVMTQTIMSFDGIWNWDSQSNLVVTQTGDEVGDLDVTAVKFTNMIW